MEETEKKKGIQVLERNLHKAYKNIQSTIVSLETMTKESTVKVAHLANLLEQFECCKTIDVRQTLPFAASFPDLNMRLLQKLSIEVTEKVQDLRGLVYLLLEIQQKISRYHKSSIDLYNKYLTEIDFHKITAASSTKPCMADLIEWLENMDKILYEEYYYKLFLLEGIQQEGDISSENLVCKWSEQDESIIQTMKDCICFMKHFLEEA